MSKIGLIVDGPGDLASLKSRFRDGYKILKTDGPRGHCVPTLELARRSKKQIQILAAYGCCRAIVLTDFEGRSEAYDTFIKQLRHAVATMAFPIPVAIVMPNQMIENWFLSDIEHLCKKKVFLRDKVHQKSFEGTNGKAQLKKLMKPGVTYSETVHGPALFSEIRFDSARKSSASLDHFLTELGATLESA